MDGPSSTRILSRIWLLAIGTVAIAVLYLAKVLFLPLAFAVLFAFLLAPLMNRLERLHLPRTVAAITVILAFTTLLGYAGWIGFSQIVAIANDLPTYRDNISQKIAAIHQPSDSAYGRAVHELEHLSNQLGLGGASATPTITSSDAKQKPIGTTPEHPVQVKDVSRETGRLDQLGGVLGALATAALSVVFTFFVLLQRNDLRNRLIRLSGERNVTVTTQAMDDASRRISRYFRLLLLVNTVYGSIILLVLYALGLPHPLLFAALAAILRFAPYVGWPFAMALPTMLSLAVFHGWEKSLIIVGTFLCLEAITGNYAEPRIYGKHTGLSSLAILVAAAFWTLVWGPVGLVLSVPLTACLVVIGRHVPSLEFLNIMLGDAPAIPQWTCFYQRLLARDERESADVLASALKDRPLEEAYDAVLIPALVRAEEDRQHSDLDDTTAHYIRRASRDLIEEFGFRENRGAEINGFESVTPAPATAPPALRLLCIPVRGETDDLAAFAGAQVFDGGPIHAFTAHSSSIDEIARRAAGDKLDAIFLCALPPVGLARCHRTYRNLRTRLPQVRIMIGIWGYSEDINEAARRISGGEEASVWIRLTDALGELRESAKRNDARPAGPGQMAEEPAA